MNNSKHVNIDGDVICYGVGFATESTRYRTIDGKLFEEEEDAVAYVTKYAADLEETYGTEWMGVPPHRVYISEPEAFVLSTVKRMIARIVKASKCDTYTVLLTGSGNFREELATIQPYKGNRLNARKPLNHGMIKQYMIDHHGAEVITGEEADDQLSIRAVENGDVIATIDKDLDNTAGMHYNWQKDRLYYVSERQADVNFHLQLLTGDGTDHIPGLFKLTGKKAMPKTKQRVMEAEDCIAMFEEVVAIYNESTSDDVTPSTIMDWLTEIGGLLWMRRRDGEIYKPYRGYIDGKYEPTSESDGDDSEQGDSVSGDTPL